MPTIEANEQTLYYERRGEGEPVLCVMGLGNDHLGWSLQADAFAADHELVLFDNRDCGQTTRCATPYLIADMAGDALALAAALGLDGFHLLGTSMGGAIAQEMAMLAPGRVRSLTLALTWAGTDAWLRRRLRYLQEDVERLSEEAFLERMMLLVFSAPFFENSRLQRWVRQTMSEHPNPQSADAFARQARACSLHEARDRVSAINAPTHVIGAEHDLLIPVWKSKELAGLLPDATLTILPGAAHGVTIEDPEAFNAAVLGFIADHHTL